MIQYLILGIQRSGTTAIHKALMQHPNVSVLTDELTISPFFDLGIRTFTFGNETEEERMSGRQAIFNAITMRGEKSGVTHCGAKACSTTSPNAARMVVDTLRRDLPKMKIILLDREDIVAQYGSGISAKRTRIYHSWDNGADSRRLKRIYLNPLRFVLYAMDCLRVSEITSGLTETHETYTVRHEKLCDDFTGEIRNICLFLGLRNLEITSNSRKLMPPPERYIANYNTLRRCEEWIKKRHATNTIPRSLRTLSNVRHFLGAVKLKIVLLYLAAGINTSVLVLLRNLLLEQKRNESI